MNANNLITVLGPGRTRPESVRADPPEAGVPEERLLPKLAPGSLIPETRLQIVRWLGQGGMGVVFEVRHLDIERRFAVKLLSLGKSSRSMRRFRKEARTISQIGSPWIVEVFDFKELSDGRLLYQMELVEGTNLYAIARDEGPLPLPRLIGLARQICKGLHDAHQVGFVHRDVKPENVMISVDTNGREHVKIVDFGLAAVVEGPKDGNTGGTPAYMSPEQCQGIDADERADIYSLCVTLYELASGHLPFQTTDPDALRSSHVATAPRPPSELVEGGLPPGLDKIILRGMAKEPDQRYASAAELEAALIELQLGLQLRTPWDDLPAPALADDRQTQRLEAGLAVLRSFEQHVERRRVLAGVVLLVLVAVAAVFGWQTHTRAQAQRVAVGQRSLEASTVRARDAASHARWVYPTVANPEAETAFRVVLELEQLDVRGVEQAGAALRDEFSKTLVGLGDNYWDREGGRRFAWEFYVQALVFGDDARAMARVELSQASVLQLRERAALGEFAPHELLANEPLVALAEPDEQLRYQKIVAIKSGRRHNHRAVADMDRLAETLGAGLPEGVARPSAEPAKPPAASLADEPVDGEPDPSPDPSQVGEPPPRPQAARSSKRASATTATVAAAQAEYDAGHSEEAVLLFRQVLARHARNIEALVGLHRIYFDRGDYREALAVAQRAVKYKPKRKDLHMFVGDACTKVSDYDCARKHYTRAQELGDAQAGHRLSLVDKLVGAK